MVIYLVILHGLIIALSFLAFGFALGAAIRAKRKTGRVSEAWKIFTAGLFLLGLSELVDIFTSIHEQVFATINFYSETTEIAALTLLFLGVVGFLRKRMDEELKQPRETYERGEAGLSEEEQGQGPTLDN